MKRFCSISKSHFENLSPYPNPLNSNYPHVNFKILPMINCFCLWGILAKSIVEILRDDDGSLRRHWKYLYNITPTMVESSWSWGAGVTAKLIQQARPKCTLWPFSLNSIHTQTHREQRVSYPKKKEQAENQSGCVV